MHKGGTNLSALKDLKIIDLSRILAGPFATMTLGDLGADIIKIESPESGDDTRKWGPPFVSGQSAYYLCANRNKRSMTLNLKTEQGRKILKELIAESDVVIHNFKTGTMEKWGLSYEKVKELNEKIIYCSISGYGESGPLKGQPGYDAMIQAMGGMMSITGSNEGGPTKVGVAIADLSAGLYATIAILAALHERERSSLGQKIDIALYDSQIALLANVASNYLLTGEIPMRYGNAHPNIVPYQTFELQDGMLIIAVGNDRQFEKLCEAIEEKELSLDPRFCTNEMRLQHREQLLKKLKEKIKTYKVKPLQQKLTDLGIPNGPIQNIQEVFLHKQTAERQMVQHMQHPLAGEIPLVGSPLKLIRTPVELNRHPPLLGEHTEDILKEMNYSVDEIKKLLDENVI
jgi:crotonobetainyl-CoA:carnitine CoA-transferase CaiB-like acyl-CoA transferase